MNVCIICGTELIGTPVMADGFNITGIIYTCPNCNNSWGEKTHKNETQWLIKENAALKARLAAIEEALGL